ncbi:helix-turn-helix domain-containing protein [Rhabdobacter roseus]|uniref:Transcriptional regulator GlxA family with amidase domain n=1 Tax=Rhabdobacter roseus TaxID=1655419 RepID=A0A840TPB7_9BACT|nr:helix-turn-helix domain-containing protein [Rhabdobacter roseus]MBB5283402.1 transcriptional regulator GlxA family with amidase domain [Rhabdobacter roseus]
MKHISILLPEGDSSLSNLEATFKMFTMANGYLERFGKKPLFDVHLVGASPEAQLSNGLFSIRPDVTIAQVKKTDLVIIPAVHGDYQAVVEANRAFFPWIYQQYKQGAEVASLCIGAFLLASTGLLKGKSCATHWMAAAEFRRMFPDVNLVDEKVITDEKGIYTSGGAYSSLNLNLYLIEKFAGREMAVLSSKIFEIDIDRSSQSPFIIFQGQKDHPDDAVKQAQEFIEQHFQDKITVDDLADRFGVGRRSFERRFKKATSNTVIEYMQRVKIEAAKKQLEAGRKTVNEVMYDVGYNDTKAFRDIFRKCTGMTPVDYRTKYNKEAMAA